MNHEIKVKLNELIDLAKQKGDKPLQVILLSIAGAYHGNQLMKLLNKMIPIIEELHSEVIDHQNRQN